MNLLNTLKSGFIKLFSLLIKENQILYIVLYDDCTCDNWPIIQNNKIMSFKLYHKAALWMKLKFPIFNSNVKIY